MLATRPVPGGEKGFTVQVLGRLVGNYRIIRELGGGAMGQVYYAEHALMGRRVAIKVIRDELSTDQDAVERFINEARLVNRIGHPNIVEITDFGQLDGNYYIIMELLEGETLEQLLERQGKLPEDEAIRVAIHVADALRAAHELDVVHRDLKPENIFLAYKPGSELSVIKVLDFGIAKLMHAPRNAHRTTTPGLVLGTPQYMSPEQCQGDELLDHRSDIYSLGIVLYRMLAGTEPFHGESVGEILTAQIEAAPPPLRNLRPDVSARTENAVLKALAKKPNLRHADMLAFRCALEGRFTPHPEANDPAHRPTEPPNQLEASDKTQKRVGGRLAQILVDRIHKNKLVLPAMPASARECLRLLDSPTNTLDKLARVIEHDPIIAPQIMRRARSALLGRGNPVRTIDQAITRMGMRNLRELVINLSTRQLFESNNPGIRKLTKNLWQHSVAVAVLARALAKRRKDMDPEVAYLAGLLHDVGKPVAAALLLELERSLDSSQAVFLGSDAWIGVVDECHREVGVALARSWNFDDDVLFAIARCDRYANDNAESIANVVCYANALAKDAGMVAGEVDAETNEALLREGERVFKLDESMVEALKKELREHENAV